MKATDKPDSYKQNPFSKYEHTKDGGSFEGPKSAPGVVLRLTDDPEQVTGNPNAQTVLTQYF